MSIFRRHPYFITLAALLVVLPVPVFAQVGADVVYGLVTAVFGMFVRLAAVLLNASVNYFVIDFGGVYADSGVGYAVDTTWIIIRDFVNMFFIFGFVYIGFKMILNSNDSNTRRWLVNLLLAALLVNFSLLATKFVVDFSNQLAAQIVVGGMSSEYSTNSAGLSQVDLGQSFMDRMGITSVWANKPENAGYGYIFGMAILFMVTAFVFAAGGIMLIIRFAILNLFLVLSPVMFLSWILPGLKDTMSRYWTMFLGRAFFAPVYLLFLYFSLQIISGLQVAIGTETKASLANPNWASTFQAVGNSGIKDINQSTTGTLPFFILICVFMIASLVIATKLSTDGAAWSQKMAGKATFGVLGRVGRNTIGRTANKYASSDKAKERAANSTVGRLALKATQATAGSSFDARGIGFVGKNKFITPGEAPKGGYKKELEDEIKERKKLYEDMGTVDPDSDEGRKKIAEQEAKLRAEAEAAENEAQIDEEELAKDKIFSEKGLKEAIQSLTNKIKGKEATLEDDLKAGTLTEKEKTDRQKEIAKDKKRVAAKEKNIALARTGDAVDKAAQELKNAKDRGIDPGLQTKAREELQKAEAAQEAELERREKENKKAKDDAATALNKENIKTRATAMVKYSRQIEQLKKMQESVWNAKGTGTLGGIAGGALTISGAGAVLGFSEAGAYGAKHKEMVEALEKVYGKDGTKKLKQDKRVAAAKDIAAAQKDTLGDDEKKPDKKEGE